MASAVPKAKSVAEAFRASAPKAAQAVGQAPSLIRELALGVTIGLAGGALWKVYHLNWRRQCQEFQEGYDKGIITTVVYDKKTVLKT